MKKRVLLILITVLIAQGIAAQEYFFEGLPKIMRNNLSDSYFIVSSKYDEIGNKKRAVEYGNMSDALKVENGDVAAASTGDTELYGKEEKAARYFFNKYTRAFFTENRNVIATIVDSRIYLPFNDEGISLQEMLTEVDSLFSLYELNDYAPDDVYNMDSIKVEIMENGYVRLDVEINDDYIPLFNEIPYWNKYQSFYFREYDNKWKLSAVSGTGG